MKKIIAVSILAACAMAPTAFAATHDGAEDAIAQRSAVCNFISAHLFGVASAINESDSNQSARKEKSVDKEKPRTFQTAATKVTYREKWGNPIVLSATFSKSYFDKRLRPKGVFLSVLLKSESDVKGDYADGCDSYALTVKFADGEVVETSISSDYVD